MATIAEIQERLQLYRTAEKKILEGNQSWDVMGNRFERANIMWVQRMITSLEMQLAQAKQGGELSHANVLFPGRR